MSRSCHRATFSSAAWRLDRTTLASPEIRSDRTGLRLWGMALEPFCPAPNGSWTSRTSVRARCRTSVAIRSRVVAVAARAQANSACTSREITWLDASAGRSPSSPHTYSSTNGSTSEYVPTTPEIFPTDTASRARRSRSRSRSSSNAHRASLWPNVVGSAWTPWVRPMHSVSRCSRARLRTAPRRVLQTPEDQVEGIAQLQGERRVEDVARRSGRGAPTGPRGRSSRPGPGRRPPRRGR